MVVNFKPPRGPNTLTSSVRARDDAIASSDGRYVSRTTTHDEDEDEDGRFVRLRVEVVDDDASTSASCDARFDAYVHETCATAGERSRDEVVVRSVAPWCDSRAVGVRAGACD